VRVLNLVQDAAALGGPRRCGAVVRLEPGSQIAEMTMKARSLPRVERRPPDGVDGRE
jgi:hypothetical protein